MSITHWVVSCIVWANGYIYLSHSHHWVIYLIAYEVVNLDSTDRDNANEGNSINFKFNDQARWRVRLPRPVSGGKNLCNASLRGNHCHRHCHKIHPGFLWGEQHLFLSPVGRSRNQDHCRAQSWDSALPLSAFPGLILIASSNVVM